jgi:hypothetical protein
MMHAALPPRAGIGTREGPLTECETAAQSYQDVHGWTVGVYGTGMWLVAGRGVEALDMPRELGKRVWTALDVPVPVFESPDDHGVRWVFPIAPHTGGDVPELAGLDVDHVRSGRSVDLPPSRFGRHRLRWITWPGIMPVPSFDTVLRAVMADQR